ncbi:hypothetical protein GS534_01925 [Rhodococcus hoagii]|nr:hypothetical protein [Prescottella equi]
MKSALYAALGWGSIYVAVFVPGLWEPSRILVVPVSAFIVGMQAGQTALVQVGLRLAIKNRWLAAFLTIGAACLTLVVSATLEEAGVNLVVSTLVGAIAGCISGTVAIGHLEDDGGQAYQRFICIRSVGLATLSMVAAGLASYSPSFAITLFMMGFFALCVPSWMSVPSHAVRAPAVGALVVAGLGLCASLFYRNDTNWIRTALVTASDFTLWNLALIFYSGVQATVGIVVVHFFYRDRQATRELLASSRFLCGPSILAFGGVAVTFGVVTSLVQHPLVIVLSASVVSIFTTIASGFCHVAGCSVWVYIGGVASTGALVYLLHRGNAVGNAWAAQLILLTVTLAAVLCFVRARKVEQK